jgi:2-methylisocitrate lyase-like PEP mutase family enzyme
MIAAAGVTAIATSSGALFWSAGVLDGNRLSVEDLLATVRRVVAAVDLPVSADVEGGDAIAPDGCGARAANFDRQHSMRATT